MWKAHGVCEVEKITSQGRAEPVAVHGPDNDLWFESRVSRSGANTEEGKPGRRMVLVLSQR
jgi:hypothetical protein